MDSEITFRTVLLAEHRNVMPAKYQSVSLQASKSVQSIALSMQIAREESPIIVPLLMFELLDQDLVLHLYRDGLQ